MKDETRDLLLEIVRCENVEKCYNGDSSCVCNDIVKVQKCEKDNFAVPEPWNGDLENAKILFVSSNPSFNENENYPKTNWNDEEIVDFFYNRFNGKYTAIKKGNVIAVRNIDGTPGKGEKFWGTARNLTAELLYENDEKGKNVKQGIDYCLTEVVHCKSKKELGVNKGSISMCFEKHFDRILSLSNCKIVVILGQKAFDAIAKMDIGVSENLYVGSKNRIYSQEIELKNGEKKLFVSLYHPAGWGEKRPTFKPFPKEELDKIKKALL